MYRNILILCLGLSLAVSQGVLAQVPGIISYQGHVDANGGNFSGTGYFKFSLITKAPWLITPITRWSNDDTAAMGNEPDNPVAVEVDHGLFSVPLGDASLDNMTTIPADVFTHNLVYLRVWFSENPEDPFDQFEDVRITSVGYAMMSANVADGSITAEKIAEDAIGEAVLADGSVTTPKLADQAVTTEKIAPDAIGTEQIDNHSIASEDLNKIIHLRALHLENEAEEERIELNGSGESGVLKMHRETIGQFLQAEGTEEGGQLKLFDAIGGVGVGNTTVDLGSAGNSGFAHFSQANGLDGVFLQGLTGSMQLYDTFGNPTVGGIGHLGNLAALNHVGVADAVGLPPSRWQAALERQPGRGGLVWTHDEGNRLSADMGSGADGGLLRLYRGGRTGTPEGTSAAPIIILDADTGANNGGVIKVKQFDEQLGAVLSANGAHANGGGLLSLRDNLGNERLRAQGGATEASAYFYNEIAFETVSIMADARDDASGNRGGQVILRQHDGHNGAILYASAPDVGGGGALSLRNTQGEPRLRAYGGPDHGSLYLYNNAGNPTVILNADNDGDGRVTTAVLEITGGSDLSEQFDIHSEEPAEPGMLVCLDPAQPGRLLLSTRAYDRLAAGVVSGAGGVKPGMVMGQEGTIADGKYPVALTGRVYCWVDADYGAVEPGDLITTSDTPGHGMKVTDSARAQGAIVGKAMSGLESGKGLVLVLVGLQ